MYTCTFTTLYMLLHKKNVHTRLMLSMYWYISYISGDTLYIWLLYKYTIIYCVTFLFSFEIDGSYTMREFTDWTPPWPVVMKGYETKTKKTCY